MSPNPKFDGVGLGLRWQFLDEILAELGDPAALGGVDFFEISPENYMRRGGFFPAAIERVGARFPLLTHGLTMSLGGSDPLGDAYMGELRRFVDRIDPPFHSDHLCFCGTGGRILHDLLPIPFTSGSAKRVAARVREAAARLERPMVVENISHYLLVGSAPLDEPAFVAEVLERSGAGLLLDVNNVFVNAKNYGYDPLEWLEGVPLERVRSIHIAGHERSAEDDLLIDTHGAPVAPDVLPMLEWVLERSGPRPVLLERDNNVPALGELLAEAALVRRAYDRGLSRFAAAHEEASRAP